jgi:hypothetical protein
VGVPLTPCKAYRLVRAIMTSPSSTWRVKDRDTSECGTIPTSGGM